MYQSQQPAGTAVTRRRVITSAALAVSPLGWSDAFAQKREDQVVIGMALEPSPGLDPTGGAASSISEVTLYNIFETLTKIRSDGSVAPLLAQAWEVSPDMTTYTFKLRRGVRFHNGEPFNAYTVKFAFERAGAAESTNKDKRTFANLAVRVVDEHTVVIFTKEIDPDFLFLLGQGTAVIVEPKSAETNAIRPVGTGPYKLEHWSRGASIALTRWDGFRSAASIKIRRAMFRFIGDPAAQVAALMAGDVDAFPRVTSRGVPQFQRSATLQVIVGRSRAKTILAINHRRKPLDDVRVRRAISAAIDRKEVIAAAADGFGAPIGSHFVPGAFGYIDTTAVNSHDPGRARMLLREAGIAVPLELSITLPPLPYARQGGEVIASQLAKVGIVARLQNVEWAQWLAGTYGGSHNFEMTIITHAEPFDLGNFAKPGYYWGYRSARFDDIYDRLKKAPRLADRANLLAQAQRLLAEDAAHAFLYQPHWVTVADRRLSGLWKDMPIFVNDLSALSWT